MTPQQIIIKDKTSGKEYAVPEDLREFADLFDKSRDSSKCYIEQWFRADGASGWAFDFNEVDSTSFPLAPSRFSILFPEQQGEMEKFVLERCEQNLEPTMYYEDANSGMYIEDDPIVDLDDNEIMDRGKLLGVQLSIAELSDSVQELIGERNRLKEECANWKAIAQQNARAVTEQADLSFKFGEIVAKERRIVREVLSEEYHANDDCKVDECLERIADKLGGMTFLPPQPKSEFPSVKEMEKSFKESQEEKCWHDAYWASRVSGRSQAEEYHDLIVKRKDNPCTPQEEAGDYWDEELQCDTRTQKAIFQTYSGEAIFPEKWKGYAPPEIPTITRTQLSECLERIEKEHKATWDTGASYILAGHAPGCICQVCTDYYKETCGLIEPSVVRSEIGKLLGGE